MSFRTDGLLFNSFSFLNLLLELGGMITMVQFFGHLLFEIFGCEAFPRHRIRGGQQGYHLFSRFMVTSSTNRGATSLVTSAKLSYLIWTIH